MPPPLSVAVIVPSYRDAGFLADALESVRRQTFTAWRCYVVDDGSPQDIGAVVSRFAEGDPRFVSLRHGRNAGLAAARNTGLRVAEEDLVQFLDADDLLTPWALEVRVAHLAARWDDGLLAGAHGQIIQCTEETGVGDLHGWRARPKLEVKDWLGCDGESPFTVHAPLVRRSVAVAVGGFDESLLNGAEDWDFWHRVLRHGHRFDPVSSVVGAYRQRRASMIREHSAVHLERADQLLSLAERYVALEPEAVASDASMPLSRARIAHRRMIRAARWAGIRAGQSGSVEEALDHALLDFLDPRGTPGTRRDEYELAARGGLVRGLGLSVHLLHHLDERSAESLNGTARRIVDGLMEHVDRERAEPSDEPVERIPLVKTWTADVLLVAETVADVHELALVAAKLEADGLRVVALDIDLVKGDEGASAAWAVSGVEVAPYNAWAFGRVRTRLVLVRRPAGPVTLELMDAIAADGGAACFLAEDSRDLEVDESPSASATWDALAPSDVVALLGGEQHAGPVGSVRKGSLFPSKLPQEESSLDEVGCQRLLAMRDAYRGGTVVIVGNGPSLNETDLSLLAGQHTFGVNAIFLAGDRLPEPLSFYVVEDTAVFKDNTEAIKRYEAGHKFFPTIYRQHFRDDEIGDNTSFFRMNMGFYGRSTGTLCHPRFSLDASQRLFCGQSVTIINLQLAHWLGFSRVVLIGMDFSYTIPADADRSGNTIVSRSDDPNHFHPDYFGAGKTWKDPKLDRVLINYRLARDVYQATGREIVNATVGGKLELFPRMTLAQALDR
jgi:hypothetical protein